MCSGKTAGSERRSPWAGGPIADAGWHRDPRTREHAVNWRIGVCAFLIMLALFGCTQSSQTRYAPYSPANDSDMRDRGSGDSGGGGSGM
jgi:hypothetical protein